MGETYFSRNVAFLVKNKKGKTQKEIASDLGIKSTAISAWRSERSFPAVNVLLNFCAYFNVKIDSLFHEDLEGFKKKTGEKDHNHKGHSTEEIRKNTYEALKYLYEKNGHDMEELNKRFPDLVE